MWLIEILSLDLGSLVKLDCCEPNQVVWEQAHINSSKQATPRKSRAKLSSGLARNARNNGAAPADQCANPQSGAHNPDRPPQVTSSRAAERPPVPNQVSQIKAAERPQVIPFKAPGHPIQGERSQFTPVKTEKHQYTSKHSSQSEKGPPPPAAAIKVTPIKTTAALPSDSTGKKAALPSESASAGKQAPGIPSSRALQKAAERGHPGMLAFILDSERHALNRADANGETGKARDDYHVYSSRSATCNAPLHSVCTAPLHSVLMSALRMTRGVRSKTPLGPQLCI